MTRINRTSLQSVHLAGRWNPAWRCCGYSLPVLKSALPLRIAESSVQFSGFTLYRRLPVPSSFRASEERGQ